MDENLRLLVEVLDVIYAIASLWSLNFKTSAGFEPLTSWRMQKSTQNSEPPRSQGLLSSQGLSLPLGWKDERPWERGWTQNSVERVRGALITNECYLNYKSHL